MIVFSVQIVCSQMFFRIFGSHGSSGSRGSSSSSSVLESLLELTDATVMMNNEPTDTLHRIWQSFPRCLGATRGIQENWILVFRCEREFCSRNFIGK